MPVTTPDWLTRRDGNVLPSRDGDSVAVYFGHEPQYLVPAVPAGGRAARRRGKEPGGHDKVTG